MTHLTPLLLNWASAIESFIFQTLSSLNLRSDVFSFTLNLSQMHQSLSTNSLLPHMSCVTFCVDPRHSQWQLRALVSVTA